MTTFQKIADGQLDEEELSDIHANINWKGSERSLTHEEYLESTRYTLDELAELENEKPFDLNEYQQLAMRTVSDWGDTERSLTYLGLGLNGEAGEVADIVKKAFFHGHPLELYNLTKELGDVLWYLAVMADKMGLSLSEVARLNIEKLNERYPQGFSEERSLNRKETHDSS